MACEYHPSQADGSGITIMGSFNYAGRANPLNDENINMLDDLDTSNPTNISAQESLANYAQDDITRIIHDQAELITF